MDQINNRKLI